MDNPQRSDSKALIVSDGRTGHLAQSLALADALGLAPLILPSALPRWRSRLRALLPVTGLPIAAEQAPRLVIGCGGRTAPMVAALKRRHGPSTIAVQIQDPRWPLSHFDLVIAPKHDHLAGDNICTIVGALSGVRPSRRPYPGQNAHVAVLIGDLGGDMAAHRLVRLIEPLRRVGVRFSIAASRRTTSGQIEQLAQHFSDPHRVLASGESQVYRNLLAEADHLFVSGDSVSLASDAVATGKPVQILPLPRPRRKLAEFHANLFAIGAARAFSGSLEAFEPRPLGDLAEARARVQLLLAQIEPVSLRAAAQPL